MKTAKLYNSLSDRGTGGGQLRQVWSTGSQALIAALLAVDGFEKTEAALYTFAAARTDLFERVSAPEIDEITATLADHFAAGGSFDGDRFRQRLEDAQRAQQIRELETSVVAAVGKRLFTDRESLVVRSEKVIVDHLQKQLLELLRTLRTRGVNASDLDAATAIESGRVDEHKVLREAAIAFADIRRGVSDWHTAQISNEDSADYELAAILRDPVGLAPLVGVALIGRTAVQTKTGKTFRPSDVPWPDPTDSIAFLAWLIGLDEDEIRIPTVKQLKRTADELQAARSAARAAAGNSLRLRFTNGLSPVSERPQPGRKFRSQDTMPGRSVLRTVAKHIDDEDDDWVVTSPDASFVANS